MALCRAAIHGVEKSRTQPSDSSDLKAQITHLVPGPPCSGTVPRASRAGLSRSERSPRTQPAKAEGEALAMGGHLWLWEGQRNSSLLWEES